MKKVIALIVALVLALMIVSVVSACTAPLAPSITLSPTQGFATTTITGTGFAADKTITITYDGAVQPTVPLTVETDCSGSFSTIISIPNELAVGPHTITVTEINGDSASATYTVVDMIGAQGVQGPKGATGAQGIQGPQGIAGLQGIAGQNGLNFNETGNVFMFNGTDGTNGLNGVDFNATGNMFVSNGTNGLNGQNGLNGKDGTNGANGTNGTNGTNGSNGASGDTDKVVYVESPKNTYLEYLLILAAAIIACTATTIACYRRWTKNKTP
ncbi:MAG: hypothetical protein ACLQO7_14205 [Candidatus Bathyarchaeia archaeon]